MDELFQDAERWRCRAISDGVADAVPSPVEKQPVAAIHRPRMLDPRQAPQQHQAAAPQAILPRIVSMTRAPVSVWAMISGVSPPNSFSGRRSHRWAFAI